MTSVHFNIVITITITNTIIIIILGLLLLLLFVCVLGAQQLSPLAQRCLSGAALDECFDFTFILVDSTKVETHTHKP